MGADLGGGERHIARRSPVAECYGPADLEPDTHPESDADHRAIGVRQRQADPVAHGVTDTLGHTDTYTECVRVGASVPEPD